DTFRGDRHDTGRHFRPPKARRCDRATGNEPRMGQSWRATLSNTVRADGFEGALNRVKPARRVIGGRPGRLAEEALWRGWARVRCPSVLLSRYGTRMSALHAIVLEKH